MMPDTTLAAPNAVRDTRADLQRLLPTDFTHKTEGDIEFVTEDTAAALAGYPVLAEDVADAIWQQAGRMQCDLISADLVVTEECPADIGEHNPNIVILYEEDGRSAQSFMSGSQAYTISGTRSFKANMSDVDAFMQATRKRRLVMYLGGFKADDLIPLDFDVEGLVDALAAMGMEEGAIEALVSMLLSGDAPPELAAVAKDILALADKGTVMEAAQIAIIQARLQTGIEAAVETAKTKPSFARHMPALLTVQQAMQSIARAAPAQLAQRLQTASPKLSERLATLKTTAALLVSTAQLARDPVLSAKERSTLSAALASARVNLFKADAQPQAVLGRLGAVLAPLAKAHDKTAPVLTRVATALRMVPETSLPARLGRVMTQLGRMTVALSAAIIAPTRETRAFVNPLSPRVMAMPMSAARAPVAAPRPAAHIPGGRMGDSAPRRSEPAATRPASVESSRPSSPVTAPVADTSSRPEPAAAVAPRPAEIATPVSAVNDNTTIVAPTPAQIVGVDPVSFAEIVMAAVVPPTITPAPAPVVSVQDIVADTPGPITGGEPGGGIEAPPADMADPVQTGSVAPEDAASPDPVTVADNDGPAETPDVETPSDDVPINEEAGPEEAEAIDDPEDAPVPGGGTPCGDPICECFGEAAAPPSGDDDRDGRPVITLEDEKVYEDTEIVITQLRQDNAVYKTRDQNDLQSLFGNMFDGAKGFTPGGPVKGPREAFHECGPGCDHGEGTANNQVFDEDGDDLLDMPMPPPSPSTPTPR